MSALVKFFSFARTPVVREACRKVILAAAIPLLSGFTQAEVGKTKQAAHFFGEECRKCLAAAQE